VTEADTAVLGLRERRRERMLDDIERIALQLFVDQGYDAVTVQEIADASDISERTFFRYFPTKEALLRRDLDRRVAQLQAAIDRRPADEPAVAAVHGALLELAVKYEADRETVLAWTRVVFAAPELALRLGAYHLAYHASVAELVAERLGVGHSDLDAQVAASTLLAAAHAASALWVSGGARGPLVPMVETALALVESGLRSSLGTRPAARVGERPRVTRRRT
jgi:AcrR family transcriptional regulator